jgi:hypothetical protein
MIDRFHISSVGPDEDALRLAFHCRNESIVDVRDALPVGARDHHGLVIRS